MANEQIIITRNNEGIELEVQFKDKKNKPINLTNCSIEVTFVDPNKNKITRSGYVKSYIDGIGGYFLEQEFTSIKGLWTTYWSIIDTDSFVTGQDTVNYYIVPMYGGLEDEENS